MCPTCDDHGFLDDWYEEPCPECNGPINASTFLTGLALAEVEREANEDVATARAINDLRSHLYNVALSN